MNTGGRAITLQALDNAALRLLATYDQMGLPCVLARKFEGDGDVRVFSTINGLAETSAFLEHASDVVFDAPAVQ